MSENNCSRKKVEKYVDGRIKEIFMYIFLGFIIIGLIVLIIGSVANIYQKNGYNDCIEDFNILKEDTEQSCKIITEGLGYESYIYKEETNWEYEKCFGLMENGGYMEIDRDLY